MQELSKIEVKKLEDRTEYYYNEQLHKEDGPAVECSNGTKFWYQNGKLHREDGPAIEWVKGDKEWYQNGKRHREDGPAIKYVNGHKEWYKDGKLHRVDGPAIEYVNGHKEWYKNGECHNTLRTPTRSVGQRSSAQGQSATAVARRPKPSGAPHCAGVHRLPAQSGRYTTPRGTVTTRPPMWSWCTDARELWQGTNK